MRGFASDNYAGAHPHVLEALRDVNAGHAPAYGADDETARFEELIHAEFGAHARAFAVFNGTAANVLCLETLTQPWEAAICARTAHLDVDECGAPERAGRKLLTAPGDHGKLAPEACAALAGRIGDEHAVQPRVVSVTQPTELGTIYTREELGALADWAHGHEMFLHVDGARLFNAAAALGEGLAGACAGADALSLGVTKAGALGAEAVVLLNPELGEGFAFLRKQSMQLGSKMRFLSAQLCALLENGLGLELAAHANAMAARLADGVRDVVEITHPVQANGVFALLGAAQTERLQRDWRFYVWDESSGEVRWMCAWDTSAEDVDAFAGAVTSTRG